MDNFKITITEEQHKQAMASAEGLESVINDCIAIAEQSFWGRSFMVICAITQENIPFLKALEEYLNSRPDLPRFEFWGFAFHCKRINPNRPTIEIFEEAEHILKSQKGPQVEGQPTENNV